VVPFPGRRIDPLNIFQIAREKLERNSVPSYLQVVEEIPKSPSEKHLYRLLREAFRPDADNVFTNPDL